jgi:hypothetical protein
MDRSESLRAADRWLRDCRNLLNYAILATPSSEARNLMTEANITLMLAADRMEELVAATREKTS